MTLEAIGCNAVKASLTADDMSGYRITPDSMSITDSATRSLLSDMLSYMEHMGLRSFGDQVTVECRPHTDGGCDMLLTAKPPVRWLFESRSDLLSAMRSGALPDQMCAIEPKGSRLLLTPKYRLSPSEAAVLSEFGTPLDDIS